jgi:hypothetical protein
MNVDNREVTKEIVLYHTIEWNTGLFAIFYLLTRFVNFHLLFSAHIFFLFPLCKMLFLEPHILFLFIHLVVCLTTGPKPLPKRVLHIVRSRACSFKWEYPLLSLRSSNSFLRLLPCRPVTSIPPCIFPSVTRCRMLFLRKMWPIQFTFRLRISCRIFLCSLTLSNRVNISITALIFFSPWTINFELAIEKL